jgi:DNA polymerase-3 subunit gamma/tau
MASRKPPAPPEDTGADAVRDDATLSMFGGAPSGGDPAAYQVLARKYRPHSFDDLVGQEAMVRTLTNAFKTGRIAHAFMLTGVRGVGKTTTARLLARALNYESDAVHQPSIEALKVEGKHCRAIIEGRHIDVLELDAASHTKVEEMRDLLDGSRYAPVSARYKVYIIDEVHMLSTASFNALLKTLEEPPPHVKFIFATTEIRKVPVTVLSRCQRFNLQRFTPEALADHLGNICKLEGARVAPEALALIARAAEGSARDGLSILDQAIVQGGGKESGGEVTADAVRDMLGLADRSRVLDLIDKAIAGDHRAALEEASSLLEQGADAPVLVKDMLDAMTEISRAKALGDGYSYAGPQDWAQRTQAMAQKLSPAQASRMWKLLLQGFEDCARAPDPPAAAQMVVLRLAAAASLPPPEDAGKPSPPGKELGAAHDGAGALAALHQPVHQAPERAKRSEPAPPVAVAIAVGHDIHPDDPPGKRLSSLREIVAELDAQRRIDLRYEIEQYVRPAEIDYGHFRYTAAPGAPHDLSNKIRTWLEQTSGVEWEVAQSDDGAPESAAEMRARKERERFASAEAHPRIAEALRLFPGAKVLRIDEPDAVDELDEATSGANVIHVDFAPRDTMERSVEEVHPELEPDHEEDDD